MQWRRELTWAPRDRAWRMAVSYMAAAIASYTLETRERPLNIAIANTATFLGAACFFVGAYLTLPTVASLRPESRTSFSCPSQWGQIGTGRGDQPVSRVPGRSCSSLLLSMLARRPTDRLGLAAVPKLVMVRECRLGDVSNRGQALVLDPAGIVGACTPESAGRRTTRSDRSAAVTPPCA